MNPQIRTSADIIVDNVEYLTDLLSDMLSTVDRIRKNLPPRDDIRMLSLSDDLGQVNEVNRVMADTTTLVWSAEKTKEILNDVFNDLSPDEM